MIALMTTASILAWLIIPVLYIRGTAPINDDVTKFLYNFSYDFHPLLVSAVAAMIIGIGVTLMIKKRIIHNFIAEIR